ncbi:hypothetical protein EDF34_2582 [Cellulomonas sp. PhB150]|nr:hypothetical protein EDF34_2582 [Cellulomonas sp. PhB150]
MLARQDAVATTAQLQQWGMTRAAIARRAASGEWTRLFRGVVLLSSGAATWRQRARGALLYAGDGAALSHRSAGFVHGFVSTPGPIVVISIPCARSVAPQPGIHVRRRRPMPVAGGALRAVGEDRTVLDLVAEARSTDDAIGIVAEAVRAGVLPGRVLLHAEASTRLPNRRLVIDLLGEARAGVESALEHRYLHDVERAHALPPAQAQVREVIDHRWIRADRVYRGYDTRVELDGQLAHPYGRTDEDVWRDNAVILAHRELTLRYRWLHVAARPCRTAAQVADALRAGGWQGTPRRCSDACEVMLGRA